MNIPTLKRKVNSSLFQNFTRVHENKIFFELFIYFLIIVDIIITLICRFIVMQKRVMKYMTRIGQKTGMLKNSKKVHRNAITVAFVAEYQNLNSEIRK